MRRKIIFKTSLSQAYYEFKAHSFIQPTKSFDIVAGVYHSSSFRGAGDEHRCQAIWANRHSPSHHM